MTGPRDLPEAVATKLMACLEEFDGDYRVKDMEALVNLIVEHGSEFPFLRELVTINEAAVARHYEQTGEVPPGIKMVQTSAEEGSNVVRLNVVHGLGSQKKTTK
jgi:hypothetical protein